LSLPSILSSVRTCFEQISDIRNVETPACNYSQTEILMSGLAMMFTQEPSMCILQVKIP